MQQDPIDVGPFRLLIEGADAWFVFRDDADLTRPGAVGAGVSDMVRALDSHREVLADKRLVVDLQDVPVIDSLAIGSLLALSKAGRQFGRLTLTHISDGVAKLLRVTQVDRLFDLVDNVVEI